MDWTPERVRALHRLADKEDIARLREENERLEAENTELRKMPSQGAWGRQLALMTDAKLRAEAERDAAVEEAKEWKREARHCGALAGVSPQTQDIYMAERAEKRRRGECTS